MCDIQSKGDFNQIYIDDFKCDILPYTLIMSIIVNFHIRCLYFSICTFNISCCIVYVRRNPNTTVMC